jgi:hypothetical protein
LRPEGVAGYFYGVLFVPGWTLFAITAIFYFGGDFPEDGGDPDGLLVSLWGGDGEISGRALLLSFFCPAA